MKNNKIVSMLVSLFVLIPVLSSCNKKQRPQEGPQEESATELKLHLIKDANNNYGGSLDEELYGEGAPLNGELDTEDAKYYARNNFYMSKCTETRTIITNFEPYQQTMADSSGLACALMMMYHDGVVDKNELTELKLLEKFEEVNDKELYTNGATPDEMVKLFEEYNYDASNETANVPTKIADISKYFIDQIQLNKYVMIGYQYGIKYQWFVVVGVDTMGNSSANDDALILANPFDCSDHYQDGFTTIGFRRFNSWFLKRDRSGRNLAVRETVVVDAKKAFDLTKYDEDNIKTLPEVPERNLMFNLDGTYGGTLDVDEYGNGNSLNMGKTLDHTKYNYFKFNDYFNYENEDSLLICSNYQAFIQSMASSCNCCSILSILNYYHFDFYSVHNNQYIKARNDQIKGSPRHYADGSQVFAPIIVGDNGRKQEALVAVYCARRSYFTDGTYKKFNNYGGVGASSLHNVPSGLGYDSKVDTKMTPGSTTICSGWGSYTRDDYDVKGEQCMMFPTYESFKHFATGHLAKHEPISTGWDPIGGHWTAIFGFDEI